MVDTMSNISTTVVLTLILLTGCANKPHHTHEKFSQIKEHTHEEFSQILANIRVCNKLEKLITDLRSELRFELKWLGRAVAIDVSRSAEELLAVLRVLSDKVANVKDSLADVEKKVKPQKLIELKHER